MHLSKSINAANGECIQQNKTYLTNNLFIINRALRKSIIVVISMQL